MAILENELIDKVKPQFENEYDVFEEVGLFSRSIDMVLIKKSLLISIEFKIKDWRKAIEQIREHQIAADYSYLCMPKRNYSEALFELLRNYGIGLWLYDFDTGQLLKKIRARKSQLQLQLYRNAIVDRFTT